MKLKRPQYYTKTMIMYVATSNFTFKRVELNFAKQKDYDLFVRHSEICICCMNHFMAFRTQRDQVNNIVICINTIVVMNVVCENVAA